MVTRETVFAVCDQLFEAGIRITRQAVQTELGGGSPNGIHKYIDEWYDALRDRFRKATHESRPKDVPVELWELLKPAWESMLSKAEEAATKALEPEREALRAHEADVTRRGKELDARAQMLIDDRNSAHDRLAEVNTTLETARQRIAQLETQHKSDTAALGDARDTIAALTRQSGIDREAFGRQLSELQDSFGKQIEALRADMKAQQDNHDRETARLMTQLDRERQEAKKRETELQGRLSATEQKLQQRSDELSRVQQSLAQANLALARAEEAARIAAEAAATPAKPVPRATKRPVKKAASSRGKKQAPPAGK